MIITTREGRRKSIRTPEECDDRLAYKIDNLSSEELKLMEVMLEKEEQKHEGRIKEADFRQKPVSMDQFLDDPEYLGKSCEMLYPKLRDDLIELFEGRYREVILSGSIGFGKTFFASIALCRVLYEMSCLTSPQETFGLSEGSEMALMLVSKNLKLAKRVLKASVDDKLKISPYFLKNWIPTFTRGELTSFPDNMYMSVGSYHSERLMGVTVTSAIMDETNFETSAKEQIVVSQGQKKTEAHYDLAERVYRTLVRRIKSRHVRAGGELPGLIIMLSSAATHGSFTDRRIKDSISDPLVFVREYSTWEVKPRGYFSGKTFFVLVGTSSLRSKILAEGETVSDVVLDETGSRVIEVPEEYRPDFEGNLEDSIRDVAGLATQAISAFFQRVEAIDECITDDRQHPFSVMEWQYGTPGAFDWTVFCNRVVRRLPGGYKEDAWVPKLNPRALRYIHLDPALSGDALGFAMGHISHWVDVVRRNLEGDHYTDRAPFIETDFMLRVLPPAGEQIFLPDIRRLVYELMGHGFNLIGFSSDQFQAAEMLQQIKRRGVNAKLLSVDRTTAPYDALKSAIYEKRISYYRYGALLRELKALEIDRIKGKVDHPRAGAKDLADAMAGMVYGLIESASRLPIYAVSGKERKQGESNRWVTGGMVPADQVDPEMVRQDRARSQDTPMPFIYGDED